MGNATDYRANAARLRTVAIDCAFPSVAAQYEQLALEYDRLADQVEQLLSNWRFAGPNTKAAINEIFATDGSSNPDRSAG